MMQPVGFDYMGRPIYQPTPQPYGQQQAYAQQQYTPPQMQPAAQQASQQQQIRSGGIVNVGSEDEARRYPVAPGYTVTMRDETAPYLYEKTMGFSQLEQPIFRKARIIFEDDAPKEPEKKKDYAEIAQLEALRNAVAADIQKLQAYIMRETSDIRTLISSGGKKKEGEPA